MLKVISFWAGPGAGKSTLAAALFSRMKRLRYKVELVTEVAKDLTYEEAWTHLGNQLKVLADQNFRLARLEGKAEWAITDSPLPLSLIYCKPGELSWLRPIVRQLWGHYDNLPFILQRTKAVYQDFGRNETENQAKALDTEIHELGKAFGAYLTLDPDDAEVENRVIKEIIRRTA